MPTVVSSFICDCKSLRVGLSRIFWRGGWLGFAGWVGFRCLVLGRCSFNAPVSCFKRQPQITLGCCACSASWEDRWTEGSEALCQGGKRQIEAQSHRESKIFFGKSTLQATRSSSLRPVRSVVCAIEKTSLDPHPSVQMLAHHPDLDASQNPAALKLV